MSGSQRPDFLAIAPIVKPSSTGEVERLQQWCSNSRDEFPPELIVGLSNEEIRELREQWDASTRFSPGGDAEWTLSARYERYIDPDKNTVRKSTIRNRRQHVPKFLKFADEADINYASDLTVAVIEAYADEICNRYENNSDATSITEAKTSRAFLNHALRYAECNVGITFPLKKDEMGLSMPLRKVSLATDRASELIPNDGDFGYAERHTALLTLCWCTMLRIGELRALDREDFDTDEGVLHVQHRPEQGTPIKNGDDEGEEKTRGGERYWPLPDDVVTVLGDYLTSKDSHPLDKNGREALFTTEEGRASDSTLRRDIYEATSCKYADKPREGGEDCDGTCNRDSPICPYSVSPHAVRHGAIEYHLDNGMTIDEVEYFGDVSRDVLLSRYDNRSERRKMKSKRPAAENSWNDFDF